MLSMPRIVRPDPHRIRETEFDSPAGPATRRSIKRNKELAKSSDWQTRQSSEPLAACAFRTLHWRWSDTRFPARSWWDLDLQDRFQSSGEGGWHKRGDIVGALQISGLWFRPFFFPLLT